MIGETQFWPVSLSEWLGVLAILAGGVGAVWLFAWRPIMEKIAQLNVRTDGHEKEITHVEGRLSSMEHAQQLGHLDVQNLRESVARLSVEVQTLITLTRDGSVTRAEELGEIRERLVRIETKVERNYKPS